VQPPTCKRVTRPLVLETRHEYCMKHWITEYVSCLQFPQRQPRKCYPQVLWDVSLIFPSRRYEEDQSPSADVGIGPGQRD
jgi:hypothetical protein